MDPLLGSPACCSPSFICLSRPSCSVHGLLPLYIISANKTFGLLLQSLLPLFNLKSEYPVQQDRTSLLSPVPRKTPAFKHGETRGVPFVGLVHGGIPSPMNNVHFPFL